MRPFIMVTDGGDHGPDKWANATAWVIAELIADDPKDAAKTRAKERFRLDVADVLQPHHDRNGRHEQGKLSSLGDERLGHGFSEYDRKADLVAAVSKCAEGKYFESAFAKPENQAVVVSIIDKHFAHVKANARSWHADKNPSGENAKALIAARATGFVAA